MSRAHLTLVAVFALCLAAIPASAQAGADDPEIVFDPPLNVNIRQTNGVAARGEILSMNDKELLLRSVSKKEVRIKLERVRSIKTSNETFEYWPGDESFSDLCARADEVPGAKLMGDGPPSKTGRSTRPAVPDRDDEEEVDPGDQRGGKAGPRPSGANASGSDILKPGRPGKSPRGNRDDDLQAAHQEIERGGQKTSGGKTGSARAEVEAESDTTDDEPQPGTTIYSCSHCEKELPLSFSSGDACPHCGKVAVFEEESAEGAALKDPPRPVQNPFAAGGQASTPAAAPAAVPVAAAPVTAAPASGGMGLSDMPMLAKVGIFAAFLVVGWFLLNRR